MKRFSKITAVMISLVLVLLSFSSCADTTWIVQSGDQQIPVGVYTYFVNYTYQTAVAYGELDQTKPLSEQTIATGEDTTEPAIDFINDIALKNVKYFCALREMYEEAGKEIDEDTLNALALLVTEEYTASKDFYEKNGVAQTSVLLASSEGVFGYMESDLFESIYGEGGEKEVTEEDMWKYIEENYVRYASLSQTTADSEGNTLTDEEIKEVENELLAIRDEVLAGEADFDTYAAEWAKEKEESTTAKHNGQTTTMVAKSTTELMEALLELEEGTMGTKTIGDIMYLLYRLPVRESNYLDDDANVDSLLRTMRSEEFTNLINERIEEMEFTVNEKAVKKFGLGKLEFENQK